MVAAALVFAACMVSSGATLAGSLCAALTTLAWLLGCRPPGRVVRASLTFGLLLLLPYFLLVPILPVAAGQAQASWTEALIVPWTILLRGLTGMLVSVATITCLDATELQPALARLPVPWLVSAILVQIVHQTGTLVAETRQVATAMGVRGAATGGRLAWRVLFALPRVWLPRIIDRAERVSSAMELRGYCDTPPAAREHVPTSRADLVTLGSAVVALALALGVRLWSGT